VDNLDAATSDPLDDAGRRLRMYTYLTQEWAHTYFAIMRVFSGTLMADLSAADVSIALVPFERDGQIGQGESAIDRVLVRLTKLTEWGNLAPGRRETNARSIAEFSHGSVRYQVNKLALRIHRDAEEVLEVPLGAREVSREMLPAIQRGLEAMRSTVSNVYVAESRNGPSSAEETLLRNRLSEQVTTLFLQHSELADTVRDFYAYVGQVVARHDLNPEEIAGLRSLLAEYIQLVVDDVLRHTVPITEAISQLQPLLPDVLRLLTPSASLGDSIERARGRAGDDWQGLADWFVSRPGKISQVEALRDATAKAIGSLLANVKRATGGAGVSPGQRTALTSLAQQFNESTVEGSHALYDRAFGLCSARHWQLAPEADDTLPTTSWRNGARTQITVPVSGQGGRSAGGRTAKVVEDPLGEQLALAEAQRQARQLETAYAELRAASTRLMEVTLSAAALAELYDLISRVMGQLDPAEGAGEFTHAHSRLRVRVLLLQGTMTRIRAETGTLTLVDASVSMTVL
jgi:uncharacterized protein (TIGR02677 family)